MSTADKIGLLPGFGWLAGHSLLVTVMLCWLLTPAGMMVVGAIGESRIVPLSSDRQFRSFFPGDLFLGLMAAGLLLTAQSLPAQARWYNATWWHVLVLCIAGLVALGMTWLEWKSGVYPTRAIFSPTKLYHNVLLYAGYGYVILTTLVADVAGMRRASFDSWMTLFVSLAIGGVWLSMVVADNRLSKDELQKKATSAHVADWTPIWSLP